jgi:hypothetical protein
MTHTEDVVDGSPVAGTGAADKPEADFKQAV